MSIEPTPPTSPRVLHKSGRSDKSSQPAGQNQLLLEQKLLALFQQAANTRKSGSARRLHTILRNSRSELALRDLLMFALHLTGAFVSLFKTSLSALLNLQRQDSGNNSLHSRKTTLPKDHSNESLP